jgi:hypothetical protein
MGTTLRIDDEIELWPEMMERLYSFLLENDEYQRIIFGEEVVLKGKTKDYFKVIDYVKH